MRPIWLYLVWMCLATVLVCGCSKKHLTNLTEPKAVGSLHVYCAPSGSTIYVDGQGAASDSGWYRDLPVGRHIVTGQARYFLTINDTVMVMADSIAVVHLQLAPVIRWGPDGTPKSEFSYAMGIAVDHHGNIFVADADANLIYKFDENGTPLTKWGATGNGGTLNYPLAVAVDAADNIYVVDHFGWSLNKFSNNGNWIASLGGWISYPLGVALDPAGNIYVTSTQGWSVDGAVIKFDPTGKVVSRWGPESLGVGSMDYPCGIDLDRSGNIYAVDMFKGRIVKLNPNGAYLTSFGTPGTGDGMLTNPRGIAIDLCAGSVSSEMTLECYSKAAAKQMNRGLATTLCGAKKPVN